MNKSISKFITAFYNELYNNYIKTKLTKQQTIKKALLYMKVSQLMLFEFFYWDFIHRSAEKKELNAR
jgi:hypothetical protein